MPKLRAHLIQTDIWFRRSSFDDLDERDKYHRRDADLKFRTWLEDYTKRMKGSKQENFFKIRIPLEAKEDTIPEDYILKERDSYHSFGEAATTRPDQNNISSEVYLRPVVPFRPISVISSKIGRKAV